MDLTREALDSTGINGGMDTPVIHHTKTCYIHRNFCYGMLVFLVVVCPFLLMADQNDAQSQLPEIPNGQNQNPSPSIEQNPRGIINMFEQ